MVYMGVYVHKVTLPVGCGVYRGIYMLANGVYIYTWNLPTCWLMVYWLVLGTCVYVNRCAVAAAAGWAGACCWAGCCCCGCCCCCCCCCCWKMAALGSNCCWFCLKPFLGIKVLRNKGLAFIRAWCVSEKRENGYCGSIAPLPGVPRREVTGCLSVS